MSILSGPAILQLISRTKAFREAGVEPPLPVIDIDPFDPARCGPNSYDVTLAPELLVYKPHHQHIDGRIAPIEGHYYVWSGLDMKTNTPTQSLSIPPEGFVLRPGTLYLGSTVERTECHGLVPWLDGRSSVGRLGMTIHVTAGKGDDGFNGRWTLEITVVEPLRIYAGVRIGQVSFMPVIGDRQPYRGKYKNQEGPAPSGLWKDFLPPTEATK